MENRKKLPQVAIVGRVNVGKSTLFNRIVGKPLAVVDSTPGVTRDRIRKPVEWDDMLFELIDTGGLFPPEEDAIWPVVRQHIEKAVEDADLVILLVDGKTGLTPYDEEIAEWLRIKNKDVILVANKTEGKRKAVEEFYALGMGEPIEISAAHGYGVGDLLDVVVEKLKAMGYQPVEQSDSGEKIRVSILGRPNVGKSSLLNAIIGEDVSVVSEVPGTTRDSIDIETDEFIFVDTAGLKRKYRDEIEYFAHLRSMRSLHYGEVIIVVMDISQPITRMDKRILGTVLEEGKAAIVALNKADLVSNTKRKELFPHIQSELIFAQFVPKIFTSARTGENLEYLQVLIKKVHQEWSKQVDPRRLLDVIEKAVERYSPPYQIFDISQVGVRPPEFKLVVEKELPRHYIRYLERNVRDNFGFLGAPIVWKQVEKRRKKKRR